MNKNSFWAKYFKSSEEIISMFLGLVIVIVVVGLVYNYFQRKRGSVDLAGITDQNQKETITPTIDLTPTLASEAAKQKSQIPTATKIPTPTRTPTPVPSKIPTRIPTTESVPTQKPQTTPIEVKAGEYTVKKNDSLWKIAVYTYGSGYNWVDIARANKLKNPGKIFAGQKLQLPDVARKEAVKTPVIGSNIQKIEGDTYTVARGDTLWTIAVRKYSDGFQWSKIWEANKKTVPKSNILKIGTKLTLPSAK